jgi:FkbM family methyltransferase
VKIAHFSIWAPNKCGLYHTAKELVLAERLAGIDAKFIAFGEKEIQTDGSFTSEKLEWAYNADILVRHSAIPTHLQCAGIPIVMALHGRPESSFRLELKGDLPVITTFSTKSLDQRYKAFTTFWPEYVDVWSSLIPKGKLFYAPVPLDLNEYNPDTPPFDFGEYKAGYNILISDMWREDVTPFNVLFAAAKYAREHKDVKIHIVGIAKEYHDTLSPFLTSLRSEGILGHIYGTTRSIKNYYTASDVLITPHVIATRSVREALASGLPVVAGSGNKYTPYQANPMDIDSFSEQIGICRGNGMDARKIAESKFRLKDTGIAMKEIFKKVLRKKGGGRKVFIDIGGHLGETVRRFYREVSDAGEYDIYTFEPDLETFKLLDANVGHIKNVNIVNAMMGTKDGMVDFFVGQANQNEGGTSLKGKQTGLVNYDKPTKVESMDLARWLRSNINKDDHVVLKMNIEGGEYDLMELLLDEDLTGLIDECFIQLHAHKFEHGEQRHRFHEIEARFWTEAKCEKYLKNKGFYPFNA